MLEKVLSEEFRRTLTGTFTDINAHHQREEVKSFNQDAARIEQELLARVEPFPIDVILDDDYLVAAVDGSGTPNYTTFDDVRVHLFTSASVVLDTNTRSGPFFRSLDQEVLTKVLGYSQPRLDTHWHSGIREDARHKMAETASYFYPVKDVEEIVLPFFRDYLNTDFTSLADLKNTNYKRYFPDLSSMEGLITRAQSLTNIVIHDELRTVFEYAAARTLLDSDLPLKFLLLDGSLSIFMHHTRQYPSMPSGFMLRELCAAAREKGVILCAVSKNHTVPFAHQIAALALKKFGRGAKWFCLLPSSADRGGGLRIYENRAYIPPKLAVPYLFSFSPDNRPSRIDFDRIWWLDNIYVENDPIATRANELAVFRELEFMSRDARWYGYPVPLAFAHEMCTFSRRSLQIARHIGESILRETEINLTNLNPLREDYNM